jgi:hypothetical protein
MKSLIKKAVSIFQNGKGTASDMMKETRGLRAGMMTLIASKIMKDPPISLNIISSH